MSLPLDYLDLLLIAGAALGVLLILLLLRGKEISRISPLEEALTSSKETIRQEQLDLLLPLLVMEERSPAFGQILALVLERRGIEELDRSPSFLEPAHYLAQATFLESEQPLIRGALCSIVRGFLDDPDIEYGCRPELPYLVDRFIEEIQREESGSEEKTL